MDATFDLSAAIQVARRRAWMVVLATALALAAAYAVTREIEPRYQATATVFVGGNAEGGDIVGNAQLAALAQSLVTSYARLAETEAVARRAAAEIDAPAAAVNGHVDADADPGIQLLRITAEASSAKRSAQIANAVARALKEKVAELSGARARTVGVQVIDVASPPAGRHSPNMSLNLLFGGLAGFLVGLALALGREKLDRRLRTAADAERELDVPVLGVLPRLSRRARRRHALARHSNPKIAEPYRRVALALGTIASRNGQQRILITSAHKSEGKSTVAAQLACAFAEDGQRTLLVEGDLRRPTLGRHFPMKNVRTVADEGARSGRKAKAAQRKQEQAAVVAPNLTILSIDLDGADPGSVLRGRTFAENVVEAARERDRVLVDTPPMLAVADTTILSRHADAVLLVIRAGKTRADEAHEVVASFKRLGVETIGAVVVGAATSRRRRYYYGGPKDSAGNLQLEHLRVRKEVTER